MTRLPEQEFLDWGWRVPFLLSIVLVAVGFVVRAKLAETPLFQEVVAKNDTVKQPVLEVLRRDWRRLPARRSGLPSPKSGWLIC